MTLEKLCPKCGVVAPFSRNKKRKDGLQVWCKRCTHEARMAWNEAHPEQVRAKQLAWAAAHPESTKASSARWYKKNVERVHARTSAWLRTNVLHVRARNKIWIKAHTESSRARRHRRRAAQAGVPHTLTHQEWRGILEYFGWACAYCLRTDRPLTQEHIIPISKGGEHTAENVVPACRRCNSRKKDRPVFLMVGPLSRARSPVVE